MPQQPNILFIISDQHNSRAMGWIVTKMAANAKASATSRFVSF
jgi:hypothetical protein